MIEVKEFLRHLVKPIFLLRVSESCIYICTSSSVSNRNFSFSEDFPSRCRRIEDPICCAFDLINPGIAFETALGSKDFFEPDLFSDCFKDVLVTNLLHFIFSVYVGVHRASHQGQLEYICRGERAHLIKDWSEVFISG